MKPVNVLLFAAAAAMLGTMVAPLSADAADKVFALVPKNMNNPFFDQARDGCMKAAEEIGGIECYYIGPGEHGGGDEQFQMVQDLIAKGVDGLAVSVSNAPAIAKAAAAAKEAGIPVVTWDSDLLPRDQALRATYIGTVNTEIGKEIGKRLIALKPDGGTYCIQSGGPAAVNMNERMKGMLDTLPADKWTQVAGCPLYNNDDFPLSIVQMTDILAKYPDLDAMLNAGGAPQMLPEAYRQLTSRYEDRIKSGELVLLFVETMDVQMGFLKDGLSHGQVGQRPYEMGYRAIYTLNDVVNGKTVPDPITVGLDVCTPETADSCKTK
jgi:ribose transport system substrate-binding protein